MTGLGALATTTLPVAMSFAGGAATISATEVTADWTGIVSSGDAVIRLPQVTWSQILNTYSIILVVAFTVTLFTTPIVRRIAIACNVVDRPDRLRKLHEAPIAYLGGLAVLFGLLAAIATSYFMFDDISIHYGNVPLAVIVGMLAIALTGVADDAWGWNPRWKIAGQLVAAAGLATQDIGVSLVKGLVIPATGWIDGLLGTQELVFQFPEPLPILGTEFDLAYWISTALLAVLVISACNAANLIDGLDGLLSGTIAIVATGLIAVCMLLAVAPFAPQVSSEMIGARLVLSFALLGVCLGFLPHNFNPATIFLGDCGSLLLGYMSITIIIMLGEYAQTYLVFAGLIMFALPIMDTALAIIRRLLAGISLSSADDQHLHHQMRRSMGSVKRAVFSLYAISAVFVTLGVLMVFMVRYYELRARVIYVIAFMLFSFIGVIAVKAARREALRRAAAAQAGSAAPVATAATTASPPAGTGPVVAAGTGTKH